MLDIKKIVITSIRNKGYTPTYDMQEHTGISYSNYIKRLKRPDNIPLAEIEHLLHCYGLRVKVQVIDENDDIYCTCISDPCNPIVTDEEWKAKRAKVAARWNLPQLAAQREAAKLLLEQEKAGEQTQKEPSAQIEMSAKQIAPPKPRRPRGRPRKNPLPEQGEKE